MPSIYKPKGMKRYRIAYKDATGKRKTTWGYRDKDATKARARQLETEAERQHAGMPTRTKKPFDDAAVAYIEELIRRGSEPHGTHVEETRRILDAIAQHCAWHNLRDINADHFRNYLQNMNDRAPRTQNRHHETLRAFINFCISHNWLSTNPIAGIKQARVGQAGRRHKRRAFDPQEFRALVAWTKSNTRAEIYRLAAYSGLRRSEINKLTTADFDLDKARWTLRPEVTKNRKQAILPMTLECQELLKHRPDVIGLKVPHVNRLHADLKAAGINRKDSQGRVLDFHSLRYFFCTQLAKVLPVQKVMVLMRHSTITLTANLYNDLGLTDAAEDDWKVPSLFQQT